MMSLPTGAVLKSPGVQVRTLRIPNVEGVAASMASDGPGIALSPDALRTQAQRLLELARAEAARLIGAAQEEANRVRGQAQVELGLAQAEAEQVRQQADARLAEAGEIIATAAQARQLLEESRAQADALLAGVEAEVAASLNAAGEEGLRTGQELAAAQVREENKAQIELVLGLAANAKMDRAQLIADAEPAIIRLGVAVARKIIAREVENDPNILAGLLTRTMLKAAGDDRIRLRLHPSAIERLGDYLTSMTARFADRGVDVVPDRTLELTGVVVETRSGAVDGSIEAQLNKVERSMLALTGE